MRRCAKRVATRRSSWTDRRMRGGAVGGGAAVFLWGGLVCAVADGGPHGGQHDERRVAVPAVPGPGFVVVEAKLGLGGVEAVFDGPALPFDLDQRLDPGAGRAPRGEERMGAVGQAAPDQRAARPGAIQRRIELVRVEVGQLPAGRGVEALGDALGRAGHRRLAVPGVERVRGADAGHVALARVAQRRLDLAHPVDAVGRHHRRRRSVSEGAGRTATGGANGTLPARARSIMRRASRGSVAKPVPSGTCAAASRALSSVQAFGT